jgi:hypothetical protein
VLGGGGGAYLALGCRCFLRYCFRHNKYSFRSSKLVIFASSPEIYPGPLLSLRLPGITAFVEYPGPFLSLLLPGITPFRCCCAASQASASAPLAPCSGLALPTLRLVLVGFRRGCVTTRELLVARLVVLAPLLVVLHPGPLLPRGPFCVRQCALTMFLKSWNFYITRSIRLRFALSDHSLNTGCGPRTIWPFRSSPRLLTLAMTRRLCDIAMSKMLIKR